MLGFTDLSKFFKKQNGTELLGVEPPLRSGYASMIVDGYPVHIPCVNGLKSDHEGIWGNGVYLGTSAECDIRLPGQYERMEKLLRKAGK